MGVFLPARPLLPIVAEWHQKFLYSPKHPSNPTYPTARVHHFIITNTRSQSWFTCCEYAFFYNSNSTKCDKTSTLEQIVYLLHLLFYMFQYLTWSNIQYYITFVMLSVFCDIRYCFFVYIFIWQLTYGTEREPSGSQMVNHSVVPKSILFPSKANGYFTVFGFNSLSLYLI